MKRVNFLLICVLSCWCASLTAAEVTVRNADELAAAILRVNSGEVLDIIIDASQTGGTLHLTSANVYEFINKGTCTIKTVDGTQVTIDGAGLYGFELTGDSDNSSNRIKIDFKNIVFANTTGYHSDTLSNLSSNTAPRFQTTFDGNSLTFSGNKDSVFRVTDTLTDSVQHSVTFQNQGHVSFQDNTSSTGGGVIDNRFDRNIAQGEVPLSNHYFENHGDVVFSRNSTLVKGGAINNYVNGIGTVGRQYFNNLGNVLFEENSAVLGGGAIYSEARHKNAYSEQIFNNAGNVTFRKNLATDATASGGAVAVTHGGGPREMSFSNLVKNVEFIGNEAGLHGGALYLLSDIPVTEAGDPGNSFSNSGNVLFTQNRANTGKGGAIASLIASAGGFNVNRFTNNGDVIFSQNYAKIDGGAIATWKVNAHNERLYSQFMNDGNVIFFGNTAENNGGAIAAGQDDLEFKMTGNLSLANNTAGAKGGAIFMGDEIEQKATSKLLFAPKTGSVVEFKNNWQGVQDISTGLFDYDNASSNAIYMYHNDGTNALTLSPETGAEIHFRDPIQTNTLVDGENKITMNGAGTIRLWNGIKYDSGTPSVNPALLGGTVVVDSGRFLAMDNAIYASDPTNMTDPTHLFFTVNNGAELGIAVDQAGGHSVIDADTFTANSANLYVTNVSSLQEGPARIYDGVIKTTQTNTAIVGNLDTMLIDNKYLKAYVQKNGDFLADLHVERVNSFQTVHGHGAAVIDVLRSIPDLMDEVRWELDDIYNYGVMTADQKSFFETLGGTALLNAFNAQRTNGTIFHQRMIAKLDDVNDRARNYRPCQRNNDYLIRVNSFNYGNQLWGDFSYVDVHQGAIDDFSTGYSYKPYLFTFGRDSRLKQWKTGYAFQYTHGKTLSGESSYTNTKSDSIAFGLYAGRNFYKTYVKATAQVGVSWNSTDTYYKPVNRRANASFNTATLGTGLEWGRVYRFGCMTNSWEFTPNLGMEYLHVYGERFGEHGAGDFNRDFGRVSYNIVELPFGFRFSKQIITEGGLIHWINPKVDLAYVRSIGDNVPKTNARFQSLAAYPWPVSSTDMGRNAFRMNAGIAIRFAQHWEVDFQYGLETRHRHSNQQFHASLIKRW